MLSIERCREFLGEDCPLSDEEMKNLRKHLYVLSAAVLSAVGVDEGQLTEGGSESE